MSATTGRYSTGSDDGGYGGCAGQGGHDDKGGDGQRPYDPHGKDHPNAGSCMHCGFDGGYKLNIVHRLAVLCPLGCPHEYPCRSALLFHVWRRHRCTTAEGVAITPQTGPAKACQVCPRAWYASENQYMQNHVNHCGNRTQSSPNV